MVTYSYVTHDLNLKLKESSSSKILASLLNMFYFALYV